MSIIDSVDFSFGGLGPPATQVAHIAAPATPSCRGGETLPSIYGALGDIVPDLDSHRDLVLFTRERCKQLTGGSGCTLPLFLDRCFGVFARILG